MNNNALTRLSDICMELMDAAIENKESPNGLRMGYLAFTAHIAQGIRAIAEIKNEYANKKFQYELEKKDNEELRELMASVFGDESFDSIADDVKEDILEYSKKKIKEWEERLNKQ